MVVNVIEPGPGRFLAQTTVSQISIGTELTYLEGNVEEGTPWSKDIIFPRRPGYNCVAKVIAVGEGVSADLVGKYFHTSMKHRKYFVLDVSDTEKYRFVPEGVDDKPAVFSTMGTITMASARMAQLRPGDVCVVYGAGIIGQMVARLAYICGAAKVIVCDMSDLCLSKLPKLPGIISANSGKCDIKEVIRKTTMVAWQILYSKPQALALWHSRKSNAWSHLESWLLPAVPRVALPLIWITVTAAVLQLSVCTMLFTIGPVVPVPIDGIPDRIMSSCWSLCARSV